MEENHHCFTRHLHGEKHREKAHQLRDNTWEIRLVEPTWMFDVWSLHILASFKYGCAKSCGLKMQNPCLKLGLPQEKHQTCKHPVYCRSQTSWLLGWWGCFTVLHTAIIAAPPPNKHLSIVCGYKPHTCPALCILIMLITESILWVGSINYSTDAIPGIMMPQCWPMVIIAKMVKQWLWQKGQSTHWYVNESRTQDLHWSCWGHLCT